MLQIREHQMRQMRSARVRSLSASWERSVDAAMLSKGSAGPEARLQALADEVVKSLTPLGDLAPLIAVDVRHAANGLVKAVKSGTPYREARAAGLLHGAAALGTWWFTDDRLLLPQEMLPMQQTLDEIVAHMLASSQGNQFKLATKREHELRDGITFALRPAMDTALPLESLKTVIAAAFPLEEGEDEALDGAPPDFRSPTQERADRFIRRERSMLAQAGVADQQLMFLCVIGDLALGLGRCVRLLSSRVDHVDDAARIIWLRRAIYGLAELAD